MNMDRESALALLLALLALPACDTLEIPLESGPPLEELSQTQLHGATVCPDGHGTAENLGFEMPEHRGLTSQVTTDNVPGWTMLGQGNFLHLRGNPRDEHTPNAPAETQYASVPIGGGLSNTISVTPGQPYVMLIAHRQGPNAIGDLAARLDGAAPPDAPNAPTVVMQHSGSTVWEWIPVPFIAQGPTVTLTVMRTENPARVVLDHRRHAHFVDIGGVWRICDAPEATTPTSGGEGEPAPEGEAAPAEGEPAAPVIE